MGCGNPGPRAAPAARFGSARSAGGGNRATRTGARRRAVNPQEALAVMRIAVEGAAQQQLDDDRIRFLAMHLGPLPFERTRDRVHRYVASNKWISSLAELLDACGLPPDEPRAGLT